LYQFNDSIAVVYKKKALMGGKLKLVVDKVFMWHETAIIDVKDAEHQNAIKVMRYPDTFLFKSEVPEDKRVLMSSVKVIMAELASEKRKEKMVLDQLAKNASVFSLDLLDTDGINGTSMTD
jgi:hypothetical protein